MPELPEVETVRRGLEPAMQGQRLDAAVARRHVRRECLVQHAADVHVDQVVRVVRVVDDQQGAVVL